MKFSSGSKLLMFVLILAMASSRVSSSSTFSCPSRTHKNSCEAKIKNMSGTLLRVKTTGDFVKYLVGRQQVFDSNF